MTTKTPKQKAQWARRQALGTVKGFNGYLINLEAVCNAVPKMAIDKLFLHTAVNTLRNQLAIFEEALRKQKPEDDKI